MTLLRNSILAEQKAHREEVANLEQNLTRVQDHLKHVIGERDDARQQLVTLWSPMSSSANTPEQMENAGPVRGQSRKEGLDTLHQC